MNEIIQEDLESIVTVLGEGARVFEDKTVLITGGAGFLGSYFVGVLHLLNEKVLKKPCRILVLDNFITGSRGGLTHQIQSSHLAKYEVDITKTLPHVVAHLMSMRETPTIRRPPTSVLNQELQDLFFASTPIDYIIHAAGLASPVFYRKYPLETIDVTISGTKNLMELACHKNTKSFLLFSSSEIYGDPDPKYVPTPETYRGNVSSIGPRACYDESKRLAETIGMVYYEFYGVPVKIVRPFNVYGPGMKPDDRRVIPAFLSSALSGNPLPVHDRGNQTRTFCYISDAVTGFLQVLISKKGGEVYNVGNDQEEITMKDLARMVKQIMPEQDVQMKLIEYPAGYPADEPQRRCPDLEKIRYELGYHTKINLETGLKRTLKWYQDSFSPTSFEV